LPGERPKLRVRLIVKFVTIFALISVFCKRTCTPMLIRDTVPDVHCIQSVRR